MSSNLPPRTARQPLPMDCDECGTSWIAKSSLTRSEIIYRSSKFTCPKCGKQCLYRIHRQKSTGPIRCVECGGPLNSYATEEITCGPCDESRLSREAMKRARTVVQDALEEERRKVLGSLPASLPVICRLSGVRWIDCQRIINEAQSAGEVVIWNVPGFRPIYRLRTEEGKK